MHSGLFAFLGLLYPDGRLPTVRWRYFAWTVVVVMVFGTVTVAFSPGPIDSLAPISNPLGIGDAPSLHDPVEVLVFVITLVAAASVLVRLQRANGVERQQIKWFAYSASLLAIAALAIAILRYRLHDIDLIVSRTLVYATLTAILAGVFEITLVAMQHVMLVLTHVEDSKFASFATAVIVAALFEPLKRRIDAFVEAIFFRQDEGILDETGTEASEGACAEWAD